MTTSNSQYVFSPWLTPVRLVQTSNLAGTYYNGLNNNGVGATFTYASSSLTIDSVAVVLDDRVLLIDQSSGYQNGIYVVHSIGSTVVLQRAEDQQCIEQIQTGQYVSVKGGSVNAGSFFTVIEPRPQVIGVSNIVYSSDPASGASVTFSGGPSVANAPAVFSNTAGDIAPQTSTALFGFGASFATGNVVATTGNLQAGSSGHAGTVASFPATASKGSLLLVGVANTGNTNTTISNAAMGQASVVSIPDPGAATADFVVAPSALVSGNFLQASGTAGLVVDSGVSVASAPQVATVTLTATQINAMYAVPVSVIAAPGAGKAIVVTGLAWDFVYGSAAFAAGGVVTLQYGSTLHAGGILTTTGIAAASLTGISANSLLTDTQIPIVATSANTVNTAIYISNATQAFTTGTGTTSTLNVFYRVVSAS
jgi:hypothetical protein